MLVKNRLSFKKYNSQTGTNIPLSPIYYNDHVGELNIYKNKPNDELKMVLYVLIKMNYYMMEFGNLK